MDQIDINRILEWIKLEKKYPTETSLILELYYSLYKNKVEFVKISKSDIEKIKKVYKNKEGFILKRNRFISKNKEYFYHFISIKLLKEKKLVNNNSNTVFTEFRNLVKDENLFTQTRQLLEFLFINYTYYSKNDILKLFVSLNHSDLNEPFFDYYYDLCKSIPFSKIKSLDSLFSLIELINEKVDANNHSRNQIYITIEHLSEYQPQLGKKLIHKIIRSEKEIFYSFLSSVLFGLSKTIGVQYSFEKAIIFLNSSEQLIRRNALFSLSRFDYSKSKLLLKKALVIYEDKFSSSLDEYCDLLTRGFGNLFKFNTDVIEKLKILSQKDNPNVQYELSYFLSYNAQFNAEGWFKYIMINLAKVKIENNWTILLLKNCLFSIRQKNPELVVEFFNNWIKSHETEGYGENTFVKIFSSIIHDLYENNKRVLEIFITRSFNIDDSKFHESMVNIIRELGIYKRYDLTFNKEELDTYVISDIDYIITKIMGYVFQNTFLIELVFCMLKREPEDTTVNQLVASAFISYIAYNYPSSSKIFLEEKKKRGSVVEKKVAKKILKYMDNYYKELHMLPRLTEFIAPSKRVRRYYLQKTKLDQRTMEKIQQESSIILQLAKKTRLKGGRAWFSKLNDGYTQKSPLNEISMSVELPLGEYKNQLAQDLFRLQCKLLRKS